MLSNDIMHKCELYKFTSNPKYYQAYETECRKKQTKNKNIKAFVGHELVYKQFFLSLYAKSQ